MNDSHSHSDVIKRRVGNPTVSYRTFFLDWITHVHAVLLRKRIEARRMSLAREWGWRHHTDTFFRFPLFVCPPGARECQAVDGHISGNIFDCFKDIGSKCYSTLYKQARTIHIHALTSSRNEPAFPSSLIALSFSTYFSMCTQFYIAKELKFDTWLWPGNNNDGIFLRHLISVGGHHLSQMLLRPRFCCIFCIFSCGAKRTQL